MGCEVENMGWEVKIIDVNVNNMGQEVINKRWDVELMGLEVNNVAWELEKKMTWEVNKKGWKLNIIWCEVKTWCVKSKAWGWENKNMQPVIKIINLEFNGMDLEVKNMGSQVDIMAWDLNNMG